MVRAGGERAGSAAAEWCVTFDDDGEHRKTARLVSCEPGQGYTVEWVDRPYPTSVLCVTLHRGNGGSRLRLRHHGVPEELVRGYRVGWPGYLGRLRHRLAGD
jgi:hypothetical protein